MAALTATLTLVATTPAATAAPAVAINVDAVTTMSDWRGGQATGTLSMTGAVADAGTARIAYRLFDQRMVATATFSGAEGFLIIGLRAALAPPSDGRQTAAGSWHTCAGTGRYRRLFAQGTWNAVLETAPVGMTVHAACLGNVRRYPPPRRSASSYASSC